MWGEPKTVAGGVGGYEGVKHTHWSDLCQEVYLQHLRHPFHAIDPARLRVYAGG